TQKSIALYKYVIKMSLICQNYSTHHKIYKYKDSEILGEIPKKAKELVQKLSINLEVLRKK
ncbi:MAG: IS1634 family transposase, partial [Thermoplasmata archaeon]